MEEGGAADGADLAVAEEPAKGHRTEFLVKNVCVVVGTAVQVLPPAQAGKQQRSSGLVLAVVGSVALQHGGQVLG